VHDDFVEKLVRRSATLRIGNPLELGTTMGPLISEKQMERVLGYIDAGQREGAHIIYGGERAGNRGYFVQPTVFTEVSSDMRIAREEIFGPVLAVTRFTQEEGAVELANETDYSLAAAVWTNDITRAHRVSGQLHAGTVWVNTYGPTDARLPWGGMGGQSGIGRDLGRSAIENYTEQKSVWVQLGAQAGTGLRQ
jgi:aldehyde dehydrogenase (NAD+)